MHNVKCEYFWIVRFLLSFSTNIIPRINAKSESIQYIIQYIYVFSVKLAERYRKLVENL